MNKWFTLNNTKNEVQCDPISIPDNWDKVKLKTYNELQAYYKSLEDNSEYDIRKVISILSEKDEEYINLLPMSFINRISESLSFISSIPKQETTNKITINGDTYYLPDMSEMKFGEWVDVNTSIKDNPNDYSTILAILCRKPNEIYDQEFINTKFDSRVEMYNNISVTQALSVLSFFLIWSKLSIPHFQTYIEKIAQEEQHIANSIGNSLKDGDYNRVFTFWQKKKLKRYQKLLNQILQKP